METKEPRMNTQYFPKLLDANMATTAYEYFRDNIQWENGIKSRSGFTRKAKSLSLTDDVMVEEILMTAMNKMQLNQNYALLGVYLNYYQDGNMYTPNHSHKGTHQIVVSLGATRTLTVGAKKYNMANGDVIIFGSSIHGIPKQPEIKEGRISIATFMKPM